MLFEKDDKVKVNENDHVSNLLITQQNQQHAYIKIRSICRLFFFTFPQYTKISLKQTGVKILTYCLYTLIPTGRHVNIPSFADELILNENFGEVQIYYSYRIDSVVSFCLPLLY